MPPRRLRCSSLKYSRYCTPPCTTRTVGAPPVGRRAVRYRGPQRGSRAGVVVGAPRPSRCDARLSPRLLSIFLCGFGGFCVVRDFFTLLGGLPRRRRRPRGRQPPRFLKSPDLSMGLALTIQRAGVSVRPACSSTGQSPPSASCSSS